MSAIAELKKVKTERHHNGMRRQSFAIISSIKFGTGSDTGKVTRVIHGSAGFLWQKCNDCAKIAENPAKTVEDTAILWLTF